MLESHFKTRNLVKNTPVCDGKILADLVVDGKHVIEILQEEKGLFTRPKTG